MTLTAEQLAHRSFASRQEWERALVILGSMADDLLPTVEGLCALGWAPTAAANELVRALDETARP